MSRVGLGAGAGILSGPAPKTLGSLMAMGRLTVYKHKMGDTSSVLAFDDVTGMKLEAGRVKEARSKEIEYVRDMRVYDEIPRSEANRKAWNVIKT